MISDRIRLSRFFLCIISYRISETSYLAKPISSHACLFEDDPLGSCIHSLIYVVVLLIYPQKLLSEGYVLTTPSTTDCTLGENHIPTNDRCIEQLM